MTLMTRAELAKELRHDVECLRDGYGDEEIALDLEEAAVYLEDDSLERGAKRYQVVREAYQTAFQADGWRFSVRRGSRGVEILTTYRRGAPGTEPTLDAAIDKWIEEERKNA